MSDVLGKISFLEVPDVSGTDVLLNAGGIPSIMSGTLAARPAAGQTGRLYLDTTNNIFYRDNGVTWDDLSPLAQVLGTANQISVAPAVIGTPATISIADDPVLPGTGAVTFPSGTTAQRPVGVVGMHRHNTSLGYGEVFNGAVWQPEGRVLQKVTGPIAASSGTATIPLDNTVPLSTEGNQIWTQSFTPISASSTIEISFMITASASINSANIILAVFAGTTNIGATAVRAATSNTAANIAARFVYQSTSTAPITFSARLGTSAAATTYCNLIGTTTLGGSLASDYLIIETL